MPHGTSRRRPLRDLIVAALLAKTALCHTGRRGAVPYGLRVAALLAIALPCLPLRREGDRDLLAVEGEMLQTPFKRHSPSPAYAGAPSTEGAKEKWVAVLFAQTALCHATNFPSAHKLVFALWQPHLSPTAPPSPPWGGTAVIYASDNGRNV